MRHLWLLVGLLTLIGSGAAQAASYQMIDGTIVDPIQYYYGGDSAYSGNNLEPGANLTGADLNYAYLRFADLTDAVLTGANLYDADLTNANFTGAGLTGADLADAYLYHADLTGADLSDAILANANLDGNLDNADLTNAWLFSAIMGFGWNWDSATWTGAKYSLNAKDNSGNPIVDTLFPTGMDQAWRDAAGMVAVPEPTTALLLGLGLVGLSARRRG